MDPCAARECVTQKTHLKWGKLTKIRINAEYAVIKTAIAVDAA